MYTLPYACVSTVCDTGTIIQIKYITVAIKIQLIHIFAALYLYIIHKNCRVNYFTRFKCSMVLYLSKLNMYAGNISYHLPLGLLKMYTTQFIAVFTYEIIYN